MSDAMKGLRLCRAVIFILAALVLISGCAKAPKDGEGERLKFAYICKDLPNEWFQRVVAGLEKKCKELDVEFVAYDARFDDALCISALDDAIRSGADGIAICTTNQSLGPEIAKKCRLSGIPLITIDDTMRDENGEPLPHIGMPTREIGALGGSALAKMAIERDFFKRGNTVKVLQIDVPGLSVISERLEGYMAALMAGTPLTRRDFFVVDSLTGMYDENMKVLRTVMPELEKPTHWIITGINDECALAGMTALRELGFDMDNVIACGLGGHLMSVEEFESGNNNYIVTITQPDMEGERAIEMLYNCVTENIQLSDIIVLGGKVATVDNYLMFFIP